MKQILILILLGVTFALNTNAQPYKHAASIKAGYSSGLTYRYFKHPETLFEAQALYNQHGFQLTLAYVYEFTPYRKRRLHYYLGIGPHAGNWNEEFALGIAAIAGAEYVFRKAPLCMGLEWKPMVNAYKYFGIALPDIAYTFRVILK